MFVVRTRMCHVLVRNRASNNIWFRLIDLVTIFDTTLTSRQTREKLQCLYENLMLNNVRKTAVLKKYINCELKLHS